jgi:UDP-N-acetylmuramate dehydrogenase
VTRDADHRLAPVSALDGAQLIGDDIEAAADDERDAIALANPRSIVGEEDREALVAALGADVKFDQPLRRHATLKIGGPADALAAPSTPDAVVATVAACTARGLPITVIGGGSNLLVRDGGVRGVVLTTRNLRGLSVDGTRIRVAAGVSTGKVLSLALKHDLGGVEFLGGVPGSVGGGLIMNAGTYVGEFKDVTDWVDSVRLTDGVRVRRTNAECGFRYRDSDLPPTEIVVEAELALRPRPRAEIEADVKALRKRRAEREPKKVSSAGSIFKNPPNDFAGRLIEACGLKGTRVGDAVCSPVHANWLVNVGAATASDLIALIEIVRAKVREVHGIELALEVKIIGED